MADQAIPSKVGDFDSDTPTTKFVAVPIREEAPMSGQPVIHNMMYPTPLPMSVPMEPTKIKSPNCLVRTLRLVPFHILNFVLGTVAFSVLLTDVSLCACLVIIYIGIPLFFGSVRMFEYFADTDVRLAGFISYGPREHRLASRLDRVSARSIGVVLYFLTVKFVIGIASCICIFLPILPIAAHIVHMCIDDIDQCWVAGWDCNKFNWDTNPVSYTFVAIGYFIVGVLIMHIVAMISRALTRAVCCERIVPTAPAMM